MVYKIFSDHQQNSLTSLTKSNSLTFQVSGNPVKLGVNSSTQNLNDVQLLIILHVASLVMVR